LALTPVVLDGNGRSSCRAFSTRALGSIRAQPFWPSVTYHSLLDRSGKLNRAPTVWWPTLAPARQRP